jgi:ubiquinone/menaquinone biosynthesis C-methylase UbiE
MNDLKPTERFSNRVENYLKYRPHYPEETIIFLKSELNFTKENIIADIGSGTGFLSELSLKNGNVVYGVEPNKEMRESGENYLNKFENFKSINGSAEQTTLKDASVDLVTAGQAFHWFDPDECRKEFQRILRNNKAVALVWNERTLNTSNFMVEYENILQNFATDYGGSTNRNLDENKIKAFFNTARLNLGCFKNTQVLDFPGLKGRSLSASYTPTEDNNNYGSFIRALEETFFKHQKNGFIEMIYETKVYLGNLV